MPKLSMSGGWPGIARATKRAGSLAVFFGGWGGNAYIPRRGNESLNCTSFWVEIAELRTT